MPGSLPCLKLTPRVFAPARQKLRFWLNCLAPVGSFHPCGLAHRSDSPLRERPVGAVDRFAESSMACCLTGLLLSSLENTWEMGSVSPENI